MKTLVAGALAASALFVGAPAMARDHDWDGHHHWDRHHRHRVCEWRHHHRVCFYR